MPHGIMIVFNVMTHWFITKYFSISQIMLIYICDVELINKKYHSILQLTITQPPTMMMGHAM
jgi:hypothetical protein